MARQLTEKQQKLLNVLFDEAGGDIVLAKKLAGYADASSTTDVVKGIKEEILEATQEYMARNAPRAADRDWETKHLIISVVSLLVV